MKSTRRIVLTAVTLVSLVVMAFSITFYSGARAQINPTEQQQTVDASVIQLFTQTAQSVVTQTVQAAFDRALTATAGATQTPPTALATLAPANVDQLNAVSVQEVDLYAGPAGTAAYLAPDGEHFAYIKPPNICLYTITGTQGQCISTEGHLRRIDTESVRWSPDSRYLAFTEEFFRTFTEPDIWILDVTAGKLTDITDDQIDRLNITDPNQTVPSIDLLPNWSLDGSRVLFMRYVRTTDSIKPAELYSIAPDGSDLQPIGTLNSTGLAVSAVAWSHDAKKIAYNFYLNTADSQDGVWISDADGSNPHQVLDTKIVPSSLAFSPDDRYLLIITSAMISLPRKPEDSLARVVDLNTGESKLVDDQHIVWGAGWAPSGTGLAYVVVDPVTHESDGLYLAATPGQPGHRVQDGSLFPPTPLEQQTLIWTANNVVLVSRGPQSGVVSITLGTKP